MTEKKLLIPQNKPKGDDGSRHLSVRLKKELLDRLDEVSEKTDYSRNQLVSVLLNLALDNCEIEEKV
jgi:metal-responsive CopG/Arc/MetJ family transcriptional regulator